MRNGWTLTRERLTYDDREPDRYDWLANEVDPDERYVVRQYDQIVLVRRCLSVSEDDLRTKIAWDGIICDPDTDWHEWALYAETLTARILAQTETLPLAV